MTPQPGQKIKIWFKNNIQIEGIVNHWSDLKASIKSENGNSIIVINNTKEDILFYKLELSENKEEIEFPKPNALQPQKVNTLPPITREPITFEDKFEDNKNVQEEFNLIANKINKSKDDFKKLGELKEELNRIEKEEIGKKLSTHTPSNTAPANYGGMGILKAAVINREPNINSSLKSLFKK